VVAIIPFYGATNPALFATERAAMDRPGLVLAALDEVLPRGTVLDVGAGDGFTAARLSTATRAVIPLEPAEGMRRPASGLRWVGGEAEHLPFAARSFAGAYATWAYFFSRDWDPTPGLAELHRVVDRGGPLVVVENLGDDELTALAAHDITGDPEVWLGLGFELLEVDTVFEFVSEDDAAALLGLYFGDRAPRRPKLRWTYRVGVFIASSSGPG
jgi:SAM-dependent methyltransferase